MTHKNHHKLASTLLALSLALPLGTLPSLSYSATAQDTYKNAKSSKFFYDKEEGWYWYQDPETGEMRKLEPVELPTPSSSQARPTDAEYAKKHPFSVQWVRVMLPRYLDNAWNDPSPENVQAYFLVQKFAMDRSQEFALNARKVILGNLLLDGSVSRPLSSIGVKSANTATVQARDNLLKKLKDKVGIFFFFKSTCPYCETQAPILRMAEVNLGFNVIAVSVDGGELKSAKFEKTYKDAGHAKRLGLESVPAIYLMNEKGEFDLIAASPVSFDSLKERILVAAERQGWITKEEAEKTRYTINPETRHNLSEELPKLLQASKSGDVASLMGFSPEKVKQIKTMTVKERQTLQDEDGFIAPNKLVSVLTNNGKATAYPYSGKLNQTELKEIENVINIPD